MRFLGPLTTGIAGITVLLFEIMKCIYSAIMLWVPKWLLTFLWTPSVNIYALWARITKNTDWSTGSLARLFACSLAPPTRGTVIDWMAIYSVFFFYSGP